MSPITLRLADGSFFFVGLAVVLAAELLLLRLRKTWLRPVLTVLAMAGIVCVVISAAPLPLWAYAIWMVLAAAGLVLLNRKETTSGVVRFFCAALAVATVGLLIAEVPHHIPPKLTIRPGATVYVLGDSISAGLDSDIRSWPAILDEMTSYPVINLAEAGATVEDAIEQAESVDKLHSVVIVEIGGNDLLLRSSDASHFRDRLDELVSSLRADQHTVLMFELPLFPFQNAWGRAQRTVAARHGVRLLPKRCLAKVLGTEGATLDGLHLSQKGHNAVARIVAGVIAQE